MEKRREGVQHFLLKFKRQNKILNIDGSKLSNLNSKNPYKGSQMMLTQKKISSLETPQVENCTDDIYTSVDNQDYVNPISEEGKFLTTFIMKDKVTPGNDFGEPHSNVVKTEENAGLNKTRSDQLNDKDIPIKELYDMTSTICVDGKNSHEFIHPDESKENTDIIQEKNKITEIHAENLNENIKSSDSQTVVDITISLPYDGQDSDQILSSSSTSLPQSGQVFEAVKAFQDLGREYDQNDDSDYSSIFQEGTWERSPSPIWSIFSYETENSSMSVPENQPISNSSKSNHKRVSQIENTEDDKEINLKLPPRSSLRSLTTLPFEEDNKEEKEKEKEKEIKHYLTLRQQIGIQDNFSSSILEPDTNRSLPSSPTSLQRPALQRSRDNRPHSYIEGFGISSSKPFRDLRDRMSFSKPFKDSLKQTSSPKSNRDFNEKILEVQDVTVQLSSSKLPKESCEISEPTISPISFKNVKEERSSPKQFLDFKQPPSSPKSFLSKPFRDVSDRINFFSSQRQLNLSEGTNNISSRRQPIFSLFSKTKSKSRHSFLA